jgi:hypothetical protein
MCFDTIRWHRSAKKAKKDIKIVKVLLYDFCNDIILRSPCQFYEYHPNVLVTSKIVKEGNSISAGLHAYRTLADALQTWISGRKFYCEFIVPKGATYYINKEEIVADKMYWTGKVWEEKTNEYVEYKK